MKCRICGGPAAANLVTAREMRFGSREEFDYFRCSSCGCLQIAEFPADMRAHYPENYYSFGRLADEAGMEGPRRLKLSLRRVLSNFRMCRFGPVRLAARRFGRGLTLPYWLEMLPGPVFTWSRVLDVGCGAGRHLLYLRDCGFRRLRGVDPYLDSSLSYAGEVRILKAALEDVQDEFDLVTLHHVFEHMPDPVGVLRQLARVLEPGGQVLIRVPLADSYAAAKYNANWVQLDAPRHFFLHTQASMKVAAEMAGFFVARVVYDSDPFQFWGSEQYTRDVPLFAPESHAVAPGKSGFTAEQLAAFAESARELNRTGQGDQACFVLKRKPAIADRHE